MNSVLEVRFTGWTATPRMPFVVSGNTVCLPAPSYSLLQGLIGCCLGRLVTAGEVSIGFHYSFDSIGKDIETRHRLASDGKRVTSHAKGTDAHIREFHVLPRLTLWLDRLDWEPHFLYPAGTPVLGRSQDILCIESVQEVPVKPVAEGELSGCMLPFGTGLQAAGQLIQLAEAFRENDVPGSGRTPTHTGIFIAVPWDSSSTVRMPGIYQLATGNNTCFYLHKLKDDH